MSQADSTNAGPAEGMSSSGHGPWLCSHWGVSLSRCSTPHSYSSSWLCLAGWPSSKKLFSLSFFQAGKLSQMLWVQ